MAGLCEILFQTLLLLVWFGQSCMLLSSIPFTSAFIRTRTEITNSENEALGMVKSSTDQCLRGPTSFFRACRGNEATDTKTSFTDECLRGAI